MSRRQEILLSVGSLNERLAELELAEGVAGRGMARTAAETEKIAAETAAGVRHFVG